MAQTDDGGVGASADHEMLKPEHDISHILAAESPFMRPEFVLDSRDIPVALDNNNNDFSQARDLHEKARLEIMQQRFLRRNNNCRQAGAGGVPRAGAANRSRSASPFLKTPKVIKNERDDSLYVKVEDLPDEVREQVRLLAEQSFESNNNTRDDQQRKLPFNEPTRLSAQPTVEEIQMCFAQVDLAILMETKPARRTSPARSAGATSTGGIRSARNTNHHHKLGAMQARRREKWAAAPRSPETPPPPPPPLSPMQDPALDFNSESDTSSQTLPILESNNNPVFGLSHPTLKMNGSSSRMQQLLVERATARRNSAMNDNDEANYDAAAKRNLGKGNKAAPSPPFAVGNNLRRSSDQIHQNHLPSFSLLRDDFIRKLEQIQAMAATASPGAADEDTHIEDLVRGHSSAESKRAYQLPVWTHGSSSTNARIRCQRSWSGHSQEEYEIIEPLVAAGHHGLSGGGDAESSTDTDS